MSTNKNKTNFKKFKNRKNKIELVFDEAKRRDFLTGFHKRKVQRKKVAQEKLAQELKEERKRLKKEARESFKQLVVSHKTIPELDNLFTKEYEDDQVTVKITELSTAEIASRNNWIGENKPLYDIHEASEEDNEEEDKDEEITVPGMELKAKPDKTVKVIKKEPNFKSKKELKKVLRKQATKKVQKSKAFQLKNKIERQKNKKKAKKLKKEEERLNEKKQKKKNRFRGKHSS